MDEREFWIKIRRSLLLIVDTIELRWGLPRSADYKLNADAPLRAAKDELYRNRPEPPHSALAPQHHDKERSA